MIEINGRFMTQKMTGVQRYAYEIVSRFERQSYKLLYPKNATLQTDYQGVAGIGVGFGSGYLWEQVSLPVTSANKKVLWSPCNMGPVMSRNQIVTIHDVFSIENPEWVSSNFHRWYKFILPILAQRSRKIITVSEYSKMRIIETLKIDESKIKVLGNGVSENFYRRDSEEIKRVRIKYNLEKDYILTLSSIEKRKNLSRILEAWASIKNEKYQMVVAGGLGSKKVFGESIDLGDTAKFIGYVEEADLPALYSGASAFIYAPLAEGFGIPPLEAAACGTRVITSNNTGILEHAQEYACLVDPYDVNDIKDKLNDILANPSICSITEDMSQRLRKKYSWEAISEGTFKEISEYA
ncbi:glycosyltransferase family 4 protein [Deinococcus radiotolerans]|nr:glycosyltransferase family 1 protein [Deinococcus radiotolerans]